MVFSALISFIFSYVFMIILVPIMIRFAKSINLVDNPNDKRKVHKKATPLVGGISIAVTFVIALLLHLFNFYDLKDQFAILISGGLILLITGVIDDKSEIQPKIKLFIQFVCVHFLIINGGLVSTLEYIPILSSLPFVLQYTFMMLLFGGVVNAYNLMDGIDGLVGGLFLIGFAWTAIAGLILGQEYIFIFAVILLGATIGYLKFNLSDEHKIFMGDGGTLFLSFMLIGLQALLLKYSYENAANGDMIFIGIVALIALPVYDALRVFIGRIRRGRSPLYPDKTHLHHILLRLIPSHKTISFYINLYSLLILVGSLVAVIFIGYYYVLLLVLTVLIIQKLIMGIHLAMEKHHRIVLNLEKN